MKLYEVPRNSKIRLLEPDTQTPPYSPGIEFSDIIEFHHIDGMYSYCKNSKGEVIHPAAWTEVEIVK